MGKRSFFIRTIGPIFFTIFFIYISHQLFRFANLDRLQLLAGILWIAFNVYSILGMILYFWLNPNSRESKSSIRIQQFGTFMQGYISYVLAQVMVRDILSFIGFFFKQEWFYYNQKEITFILIAPLFFMFLGRIIVYIGPFVRKVIIFHSHLPDDLVGISFVQISDMHIGPGVTFKKMQKIVNKVNNINPDFVFLTGDIVDHLDHWFNKEIEMLGKIKAKYGVFFIPGNHEYYWGFHPIIEKINKLGITVLLNQNKIIKINQATIAVYGIPDLAAKYFSLEEPNFEKAISGAESADFKVLLAHQPKTADEAKNYKFDLQLSGHTHGGQFIPWSLIIRLFQKYPKGLFKIGHMQLYVNRGTGYWGPPDRLGTYGEITHLILEKKINLTQVY